MYFINVSQINKGMHLKVLETTYDRSNIEFQKEFEFVLKN